MVDQGQISYDRDCEIWRAAGRKDKHRFTAVELVGDRLIATDDRMLASVPVKIEGDVPERFPLHPDALKDARKATRVGQKALMVFEGEPRAAGAPGGARHPAYSCGHQHIPPVEEAMPTGDYVAEIGLDPRRLYELAKAIGADNGVMLWVQKEGSIVVHKVDKEGHLCNDPNDAFGLLFPVTPSS